MNHIFTKYLIYWVHNRYIHTIQIKKNLHLCSALTAKVKAKLWGRGKTRHGEDVELYRISLQVIVVTNRCVRYNMDII